MKQKELFRLVCQCEDDNGVKCGRNMSREEFDQDGMCSRCADGLWDTFVQPLSNGKETKPFVF